MGVTRIELDILADRAAHAAWHIGGVYTNSILNSWDDDATVLENVDAHLSELRKACAPFDGKQAALDFLAIANADYVRAWKFGRHSTQTATAWLLWASSVLSRLEAGWSDQPKEQGWSFSHEDLGHVRVPPMEEIRSTLLEADAEREREHLRALRLLMANERKPSTTPAMPPGLTPAQQDVWNVVMENGQRMTTRDILDELSRRDIPQGESGIKQTLALFTQRLRVWDNRRDLRPAGYGPPSWGES